MRTANWTWPAHSGLRHRCLRFHRLVDAAHFRQGLRDQTDRSEWRNHAGFEVWRLISTKWVGIAAAAKRHRVFYRLKDSVSCISIFEI